MPPKTSQKPPTQPKPKKGDDPRPVLYPDIRVNGVLIPREALRVSVKKAKEILGWEEETAKVKFGADFFLTDLNGKKVRLTNNTGNRAWNEGWSLTLAQDTLTGYFEFNGETAIVGKYGTVLSAQHRLIGLVFAYQKWMKDDAEGKHWRKVHPEEPFIETLLVTGIEETLRVKNSLDNVRPRDFSDVMYSDPTFFGDKPPGARRVMCRAVAYAVQELWKRTKFSQEAYALKRTHSGSVAFLNAHPRIKECVSHLHDENEDNRVGSVFGSLGYAAAQMYLMACSGTPDDAVKSYYDAKTRSEKGLDFGRWDRAEEFWTCLASGAAEFQTVRDALALLRDPDTNEGGSRREKLLVIQRAWDEFSEDKPMKLETIKLDKSDYSTPDTNGLKHQIEFADFGGIDLSDADVQKKPETHVTPSEVAKAAAAIRTKNGHASTIEADADDRPAPMTNEPDEVKPATKPAAKTAITVLDRLNRLWADNPGTVVLLKRDDNWYAVYGKDATALTKLLKTKVNADKDVTGLVKFDFPAKDYPAVVALLKKDKRKVGVADGDGFREVREVRSAGI